MFIQGAITVLRPLDRETIASYSLSLAALDNPLSDEKRRTTRQAVILVSDVNDNPPQWQGVSGDEGYRAQVVEKTQPGDTVVKISPASIAATDLDTGDNARLTYRMDYDDDNQGKHTRCTWSVKENQHVLILPKTVLW
jgi:hypothetical protein